jgi:uncharacterized repeat protein (TIGR03803 family)
VQGALYGTTREGANAGNGSVFKLTPPAGGGTPWSLTVLHSFTGAPDGGNPYAGLVFDRTGALYGTTSAGGNSGFGTVFFVQPSPKNTHDFNGDGFSDIAWRDTSGDVGLWLMSGASVLSCGRPAMARPLRLCSSPPR